MKFTQLVTGAAILLLSNLVVAADTPCVSDCVLKVTTDFSGRPPFKRRVEKLSAVDVAQLELVQADISAGKEIVVRTTDFRGRPPFKRRTKKLVVVDIAQAEILEPENSAKKTSSAKTGNSISKRR